MSTAILIGNSDGIGLSATRMLLEKGWIVAGLSRSASPIQNKAYSHTIVSFEDERFTDHLRESMKLLGHIDLCVYCAGIGELMDFSRMENELNIFQVNLMGMVRTVVEMVPIFIEQGSGHFIGLSSLADELLSAEAPSYHASKAAFSRYLESLALTLRPRGIYMTNLRFGFVETKMAKGDIKPFMMDVDQAVRHLLKCIRKKPVRYTAPRISIPLVKLRRLMMKISAF